MRILRPMTAALAAATSALALASCAEPTTAPAARAPSAPGLSVATYGAAQGTLLVCPERAAKTFAFTIDERGARFAKHGIAIDVPAGALPGPQRFVVSVPRSRYVEADIHAVGHEHYQFARPVTVTFDYARCGNAVEAAPSLDVWYVDGDKALLEAMPSADARPGKKITFQTTHLSGYITAYRTQPTPSDSTEAP